MRTALCLQLLLLLHCRGQQQQQRPPPEDDWTAGCPRSACRCKWVSGKRTADCGQGGLRGLPDFGQPDKIQVLHMRGNALGSLPERAFREKGLINVQKVFMQVKNKNTDILNQIFSLCLIIFQNLLQWCL